MFGDFDDRLAVGVHQGVGDRVRLGPIAELLERSPRRSPCASPRHLAAALEPAGDARHRLADDRRRASPTQPRRSRKIRSVCRQHSYMSVPGITWSSTKWQVRNQSSGWMSASARISPRPKRPPSGSRCDDAIDQLHPAARQPQRIAQRDDPRTPARSSRPGRRGAGRRSARRRSDSTAIGRQLGRVVGLDARPRPAVELGLHDALAGGQLLGGEEAGAAVASSSAAARRRPCLEAEAEQVRVALAEEAVDVDVVADHLARAGQAAVEGHDGVEQAIDGQAARLEVDAEVARQEQVGLARLDGDAGGNPAAVEIPGAGLDVVLGDDAAGVSDRGSPSMRRMRSTSISGSSGRRTRVGKASTSAKSGPRTRPMEPTANSRHCVRDRAIVAASAGGLRLALLEAFQEGSLKRQVRRSPCCALVGAAEVGGVGLAAGLAASQRSAPAAASGRGRQPCVAVGNRKPRSTAQRTCP